MTNREVKMYEAGCGWPECTCKVPDYAFSGHVRVDYCEALKAAEKAKIKVEYLPRYLPTSHVE